MSSDSDDSPAPTPNPTAGAGGSNPALQLALQQVMGPGAAAAAGGGGGSGVAEQQPPQAMAAAGTASSSNNGGFDLQAQIQQMMAMQQQPQTQPEQQQQQINTNADANAATPGQQGQEQVPPTTGTPGVTAPMNGAAGMMQQPGQGPLNNMSQLAGLNPAMINQFANPQQQQQMQQMQAMQNPQMQQQMQQLMQQQALLNNQMALMGGFGMGAATAGMNMNGLMGAPQLPINMQMQAMQMGLGAGAATPGGVNPNQLAAIAGIPGMAGFNAVGGAMGGPMGVAGMTNPGAAAAAAAAMGMGITSSAGADAVDAGGSAGQSSKEPAFPVKLHRILSNPEFRDVITWLPHGRSWRVTKPKAFEERVIPLYFRHAKYASFMRQVNGWGFKRMTQGPDHNSYYHELFLRGMPQEVLKMRRPPKVKPGSAAPPSPEPTAKPDFYAMSKLNPLPDIDGSVAPPLPNIDTSEKPKKSRKSKKKKKSKSSSSDIGDANAGDSQRKADLVRQLKEVIGNDEDDDGPVSAGGSAAGVPAPATVGVPAVPAPAMTATPNGVGAQPGLQQNPQMAGLLGGANGATAPGQGDQQTQLLLQQLQQSNPGALLQLLQQQQQQQQQQPAQTVIPQQSQPAASPSAPVPAPAPQLPTAQDIDNENAQDSKSVSSDGKQDIVAV